MSNQVFIVTFDDVKSADLVLKDLESLQKQGDVELSDAVTVVKDADGKLKVSETTDFTTGRGAVTGGGLGLIIGLIFGGPIGGLVLGAAAGALIGKKVDLGISKEKIELVSNSMVDSSSAIFLQVVSVRQEGILPALMQKYDGTLHEFELSDEHLADIDQTLTETDIRH
ncbi:MAG: DUF1269 domain-containing protein [Candidatus Promineifilaceae bacterium]|jgi:uncharacterized membrane protein